MTELTINIIPYNPKEHLDCGLIEPCIEDIAKKYYEALGWEVYHSRQKEAIIAKLRKCKGSSCLIQRPDVRYMWVGCPDLFLFKQWKNSEGMCFSVPTFKFVEVKSWNDGLHLNQFIWISSFGFPTEIAFFISTDELTEFPAFVHLFKGKERKYFLELNSDLAKVKKVINIREAYANKFRVDD